MALLVNAQGLVKSYGAEPLFRNIALSVSEGERLGLVGPNGSGKSTLLEILSGRRDPDAGEVATRKNTRIGYIAQDSVFPAGLTVHAVITEAMDRYAVPHDDRQAREAETLGRTGFADLELEAAALSGGWRKRLAIAEALVQKPDILLLDEPTNHLDLAGIEWLEELLQNARFCLRCGEPRPLFSGERRHRHGGAEPRLSGRHVASAGKLQQVSRSERRVPACAGEAAGSARKPRSHGNRVAAARPQGAGDQSQSSHRQGERDDRRAGGSQCAARSEFRGYRFLGDGPQNQAADRAGWRHLRVWRTQRIRRSEFVFTAGMRVGLVGPNGSGKTTLLRLLRGDRAGRRERCARPTRCGSSISSRLRSSIRM